MGSSSSVRRTTNSSQKTEDGLPLMKSKSGMNLTTWKNSPEQKGLNPRHFHLPDDLKAAIVLGEPVDFAFYEKHSGIYSSARLKVQYACVACGASHLTDFKHLNKRKRIKAALCPDCVMGAVKTNKEWLLANATAQLKIQSTPEQKAKNAAGVSKFWAENPGKLESMRQSVIAAQQRPDLKEKYRVREAWNGRGISGDYHSRWGWITFDSSYELAFLTALEVRNDVALVKRGPIIEYLHDSVGRNYHMDFEVHFASGQRWWCEVKSGYVGKQRDRIDKLRQKLSAALERSRSGHVDRVVMVTEQNSEELFQFKMPSGSYRTALFRKFHSKIIFADNKHEERFK